MSVTAATISALAAALLFGMSAVSERTGTKKVKRERAQSPKFLGACLAVLGPLGFMLNQRAFQHSTRVSQVLSIVTTVNPVVAVALGAGLSLPTTRTEGRGWECTGGLLNSRRLGQSTRPLC